MGEMIGRGWGCVTEKIIREDRWELRWMGMYYGGN
jgi:hypothetical protein